MVKLDMSHFEKFYFYNIIELSDYRHPQKINRGNADVRKRK